MKSKDKIYAEATAKYLQRHNKAYLADAAMPGSDRSYREVWLALKRQYIKNLAAKGYPVSSPEDIARIICRVHNQDSAK